MLGVSLAIGAVAGIFGGLIGIGGGSVMIPLMVAWAKLGQHKAHGTSLVAVVFTGLVGAISYAGHGSVDVKAALLLAATAVLTARAGARYAHLIPEWKLKRFFGGFLLLTCGLLLLKPYLTHVAVGGTWSADGALLLLGVFTGFLSGMMGVGGGTVMVPGMVLLLGMDQYTAQGTSLLAMVPAGIVGSWTHYRLGDVDMRLLYGLVPGVIVGSFVGGMTAHLVPEDVLRLLFVAVLIWTALRYVRSKKPS